MIKTQEFAIGRNVRLIMPSLCAVGIVAVSAAATRGTILGYPSMLNVMIAASLDSWGVLVFATSLLTYIITGTLSQGLVQIGSMIMIIGVKLALLRKTGPERPAVKEAANAILTTGNMLFCSVLISAVTRTDPYLTGYRIIFSVLCGCMTYFVRATAKVVKADGVLDVNGINGGFLGASYVTAIAILSSVSFAGIDLGRIAGIFAVLFMSNKYKHIGGAVCGALTTCGVMLCSPELSKNTLLLASCGLLCGALAGLGQVMSSLILIFSTAVSLMAVGFNTDTFPMLTDVAIGGVLFAAIPSEVTRKLLRRLGNKRSAVNIAGQTAGSKLAFASGTIKDVRTRLSDISKLLEEEARKTPALSSEVRDRVCSACSVRDVCWEDNKDKLDPVFEMIERKTYEQGKLSGGDLDDIFPLCKRGDKLAEGFTGRYSEIVTEQTGRVKINELRELLSDQLYAMEELLSDISCRVSGITEVDGAMSEKVRGFLLRNGITNARACVYSDAQHAGRVEIFTPTEIKEDMVRWTVEIGNITDCELEMPVISQADGMYKIVFSECPRYSTESGSAQFSAEEECCGDTLERIWLTRSEFAVILSDGMGTGKRARLDSSFASSLISRFLASEISPETSVHLINSILRVKGWDESFATADIALFDLCSGAVRFIKAGAAPSYILRDEVLIKVEGQAFPVGILSRTDPDSFSYKLFDGDRVIVVSDGVSEEALKSAVTEMNRCDMEAQQASELVGEYARAARDISGKVRKIDDISVCVVDVNINK